MKALSLHQPWLPTITEIPEDDDPKRHENRRWLDRTPVLHVARRLVGQRIALHASQRYVRKEFDDTIERILDIVKPEAGEKRLAFLKPFARMMVPLTGRHHGEGTWVPASGMPFGAIVATAELADVTWTTDRGHRVRHMGTGAGVAGRGDACLLCGAVGEARQSACPRPDRWAFPHHVGLILREVRKLHESISLAGAQWFFEVPTEVAEVLR